MDTGKLINNYDFYEGFEDEPEIELVIVENPEFNIHIWSGYISDIFDKPKFDENGWKGFTRDYQQCERTFEAEGVSIDINEYYLDLLNYKNKQFRFEETKECYELLCHFLEYAKGEKVTVIVNWW